jgi:hypothetical protein
MTKVHQFSVDIPCVTLADMTAAITTTLYEQARRADMRKGRTHPRDFHITKRAMYVARELERVRKAIEEDA